MLPVAKQICDRLAANHPKELTVEQRIEARGQRVYLDAFRNTFGGTVVAPYSVRRREKAPFSMPLDWSDVKPSSRSVQIQSRQLQKDSGRARSVEGFFQEPAVPATRRD